MKLFLSWFHPKMPFFVVYMLQQVEYRSEPFLGWLRHLATNHQSLTSVMHRQTLRLTARAKATLAVLYMLGLGWLAILIWLGVQAFDQPELVIIIAALLVMYPLIVCFVAAAIVELSHALIVAPAERRQIAMTKTILQNHPGTTIVIAGSYGKTTMKELLAKALGTKLRVAATAGNRNTPLAHAQFARSLNGSEDVVIFELGEGAPGDVERFASTLHPDMAIITGLAPNHLDRYGTVEELAQDFMALRNYVPTDRLYYAADSPLLKEYIGPDDQTYDANGGKAWRVSSVKISAELTSFELRYRDEEIHIESTLLGRHQVAPLALVAVLALDMGLTAKELERASKAVKPYEHRMNPYRLQGATIIDDTYNGNLEGIMAGLSFLQEIEAKRKVYVTPGLVDQGDEAEAVHRTIAAKIVEVAPNLLVLMRNSATDIIAAELAKLRYIGEIQIQDDPLAFYQGLEHIVRAGDVVLMQNDWTDNYY
jgi:UDP-N-acetylmuramoyl-tripeptide--D-alanyl-D-alanine ligase